MKATRQNNGSTVRGGISSMAKQVLQFSSLQTRLVKREVQSQNLLHQ
jgi:hypothetical protein